MPLGKALNPTGSEHLSREVSPGRVSCYSAAYSVNGPITGITDDDDDDILL